MYPNYDREIIDIALNWKADFIAGCDEVGRGPLAGPVVAATLFLIPEKKKFFKLMKDDLSNYFLREITDSKKLNQIKRIELIKKLGVDEKILLTKKEPTFEFTLGPGILAKISIKEISAAKVDQLNILKASLLAMKQSFLDILPVDSRGILMVDGKFPIESCGQTIKILPLIKGDLRSKIIGLASIFAKTYRDSLMRKWSKKYPVYGFENHFGYPTQMHRDAIEKYGPCKIHRQTFKGVKEFLLNS